MKAKLVPPTPENIQKVALSIQNDEVVGMPTETVYGLAGNARSPLALARIFETKERPTFDPLIIHVSASNRRLEDLETLNLVDLSKIFASTRVQLQALMDQFWPGPLTLVLPKHLSVPDLATSGLPSVGIRMPKHPIAQALIEAARTPLAAPSANRFGRISPTTAEAVAQELGDRISWILDGGSSEVGVESTILGWDSDHSFRILRPGGIGREQIEKVLGFAIESAASKTAQARVNSPLAPGMLESHYAPRAQLILLPKVLSQLESHDLAPWKSNDKVGLLMISGDRSHGALTLSKLLGRPKGLRGKPSVIARSLSLTGDLKEAARNLFSEMRWLDSQDLKLIFAEPCPTQEGLGFAIGDRLRRAGAPRPPEI